MGNTELKFDVYGALYILAVNYHHGQNSQLYQVLCRLEDMGYSPSRSIENGNFESYEMEILYDTFKLRLV